MKPLTGKHALVTGGTRGIGAAVAERLMRAGAKVVITGTGRRLASGRFRHLSVDLRDPLQTERFAQEVRSLGVDILINNAGVNRISPFEDIRAQDFDDIHAVNVRGPLLITQAVLPHMKQSGWGRIVNITSIFGTISKEFRASYSTSKFGLEGMTAALAAEVAKEGILANCVAPGFIDTDLTRAILPKAARRKLAARIPIGRLGKPSEVGALVAWLASAENTYISGQTILIDGGFTRV